MKLRIVQFSSDSRLFLSLRPNILLSKLLSNALSLCSVLDLGTKLHNIGKTLMQNIWLIIFKCYTALRCLTACFSCLEGSFNKPVIFATDRVWHPTYDHEGSARTSILIPENVGRD